jgi:4-hydroxy-3-methylbut-2-enyl diphosphate reductase IspH
MDYIQYIGGELYNFLDKETLPQINTTSKFAVLSQTTLNFKKIEKLINVIKEKYPNAQFPPMSDICKATYERQETILQNLDQFEALIVIG